MKTHILGMAKSSLSLEGAKSSKLELDLFKLAFAVAALREKGEAAFGYLLVVTQIAKKRAEFWVDKYKIGDRVEVLIAELTPEQLSELKTEKGRNADGLHSGVTGFSIARLGQEFGENALREKIESRHPNVVEHDKEFPQGINWDYYGIIGTPDQANLNAPRCCPRRP